jgi:hypothetical protein
MNNISRLRGRWTLVAVIAVLSVAGAIWAAQAVSGNVAGKPMTMTAMLPQGALVSIESPDFGALLHDWEKSPEQTAWLNSGNYGVFSRSRLFSRLAEAQNEFAAAAGMPPDGAFLDSVAGSNSIFAWYDIGKLEFLYITKLPPGKAEQTRLMQSKTGFSRRQVGSSTFYLRTRGQEEDSGANPASDADSNNPMSNSISDAHKRTVAFAVSGDYLLLATREDLMADALGLIEHTSSDSLATEPWFVDVEKAMGPRPQAPALRMALNLEEVVKTPYFRSYWPPQNVTEIGQYRAALCDLYREPAQVREERVLLPKIVEDPGASQTDLAGLTALVPPGSGVYRAVATGDAAMAVTALDEKLLTRNITGYRDTSNAPEEDLAEHDAGSSTLAMGDLETRIDAPPTAAAKPEDRLRGLRALMAAADVTAVLTVDSNQPGEIDTHEGAGSMWVPFHSAVAIRSARPWDEAGIESALAQTLEPQLSAGALGMNWQRAAAGYSSLGEVRPLHIAVRGNLLLAADDAGMMQAMLTRAQAARQAPVQARLVAGFDHAASSAPFARVSGLIDRTGPPAQSSPSPGTQPAFFSGNVLTLSQTFAAMKSEHVIERRDGPVMRQTVTYAWAR